MFLFIVLRRHLICTAVRGEMTNFSSRAVCVCVYYCSLGFVICTSSVWYTALFIFFFFPVGGGTAGVAVASRLAENEAHYVLLIEAGPAVSSTLHDIPLATSVFQMSPIDWQHRTESQQNACLAMKDQVGGIQHTSRRPKVRRTPNSWKINR